MRSLQGLRLLYIDDMATVRNVIKKLLDELKIPGAEAAIDGNDAWIKIKEGAQTGKYYDLILCDWNMPDLDGIDLVRMLRIHPDPNVRDVRFIMITGSDGKVREAIECGVDNFISKPFNAQELRKKIEFVLRFDSEPLKKVA